MMREPAFRILSTMLVLLAAAGTAWPAKRLGPPSDFVLDEVNKAAAVTALGREGDDGIRFQRLAELHGETPETLTVRVGAGVAGEIEEGESYVIGYTDLLRDRRTHIYHPDPRGPRLLEIPAVGPALLEDSPAMRALTTERPEGEELSDRARLDAVLTQLQRPDVQSRRFVLAELVLRSDLAGMVGEAESEVLRKVAGEGGLEPMAHDYLLRAARPHAESWGKEWLAEDCRRLLEAHGTDLDLLSPVPSMLKMALETLEVTGEPRDAKLAARHVASNNPGVGKAAFAAMTALDPELAREQGPELLERDDVHADTRRVVQRFLESGEEAS